MTQTSHNPTPTNGSGRRGWPLWEVFIRARRGEGVSIWVVPSTAIVASSPEEKDPFFDPALDKAYRHPTFYDIPEGVEHL